MIVVNIYNLEEDCEWDHVFRRQFWCGFFSRSVTVERPRNWSMMGVNAFQHIPSSEFTCVVSLLNFIY